jgi:ubiquinone/menaquinone biosynthesis C-methylase UbiE
MNQPPGANAPYTIESNDAEYRRLETLAEANAEFVRDGCRRVGVPPGASVIEVGCGAPGALLPLAEVVGPDGRVVGIDFNADTVVAAQEIAKRRQAPNITVIHANINTLDPADVCPPGGFDLAYCHLVLLHQVDPVATVRRMGALVRSGGHMLMQEIVLDPRCAEPPLVEPASPAMQQWHTLTAAVIRHAGGRPDIARYLDETVKEAGLQPVRQHAYLTWTGPREAAQVLQSASDTLEGMRQAIVARSLATGVEVDALLRALAEEQSTSFRTFLSPLYVEMIARVP